MSLIPVTPDSLPLKKDEVKGRWVLCLLQTPSKRIWCIGRYNTEYKKTNPWRDDYDHPIEKVTHYCELPEMPE